MLCGVLNSSYEIVSTTKKKTGDASRSEETFERIVACVQAALDDAGVAASEVVALGVAAPGPIDLRTGTLLETPNLGFQQFPLAERLSREVGIDVRVENDVNAGLYGEYVKGAAGRYRHVLGLFPGTGVGGAIVIDGKLYRGAQGGAGEIGHMIMQLDGRLCGCGQYGCLEAMVSRGAMAREAALLVTNGKAPTIAEKAGTDVSKMRAGVFKKAIDAGDTEVARLVDRAADILGIGMANCVNIFNPEAIVVGGGLVEKLGSSYLDRAAASMRSHAMSHLAAGVEIIAATLGDDAAVVGAAAVAHEHVRESRGGGR